MQTIPEKEVSYGHLPVAGNVGHNRMVYLGMSSQISHPVEGKLLIKPRKVAMPG